jgi:hypothetical protein
MSEPSAFMLEQFEDQCIYPKGLWGEEENAPSSALQAKVSICPGSFESTLHS